MLSRLAGRCCFLNRLAGVRFHRREHRFDEGASPEGRSAAADAPRRRHPAT